MVKKQCNLLQLAFYNVIFGGKELAANPAQADLQLVTFFLDREEYGIDVMGVREIITMTEITRTANTPSQVEGIINLRGRIVPIISLRKRFGLPEPEGAQAIFLGAIASGTEQAIGASANSISYLAGVNLGRKLSEGVPRSADLEQALGYTRELLERNDYLWLFETFRTHDREALLREGEEGTEVMLVFRDCMIRQALFCFGHSQKGSLCNLMYGFFAGALQNIMGRRSELEIVHAGENACYKRLLVRREHD